MGEAIIVAVITGGLSLIGTVITVLATSQKTEQAMQVAQAVTDTKIEELTREVREHNGFARRLPVVEQQIKTIEKRLDDLEDDRK
jgi:hypothetical protein